MQSLGIQLHENSFTFQKLSEAQMHDKVWKNAYGMHFFSDVLTATDTVVVA